MRLIVLASRNCENVRGHSSAGNCTSPKIRRGRVESSSLPSAHSSFFPDQKHLANWSFNSSGTFGSMLDRLTEPMLFPSSDCKTITTRRTWEEESVYCLRSQTAPLLQPGATRVAILATIILFMLFLDDVMRSVSCITFSWLLRNSGEMWLQEVWRFNSIRKSCTVRIGPLSLVSCLPPLPVSKTRRQTSPMLGWMPSQMRLVRHHSLSAITMLLLSKTVGRPCSNQTAVESKRRMKAGGTAGCVVLRKHSCAIMAEAYRSA
mmetsp:Transcript_99501/g.213151  ORF Transcript_99501/g.213151 Transcript_99501/m.213151 type:complete len:262 (+) Transcript_99501:2029-2814(+)